MIHSAIYLALSDDNQVVTHTQSQASMAIAAWEECLLPISMGSTAFFGELSYHESEGVSLYLDERERLIKALGDNQAMILRNHGLLTDGRTIAETFLRHYRLERAAEDQLDATAAGKLRILTDNIATKSGAEVKEFAAMGASEDALEFEAIMRKLDRIDDSYRH